MLNSKVCGHFKLMMVEAKFKELKVCQHDEIKILGIVNLEQCLYSATALVKHDIY